MELTGEKVINAPQTRVYDALHDPVILRQTIPGVQTLTMAGDGHYAITAALKVGPLRPTFSGTVAVYNADRPSGYSLRGEASGAGGGAVSGNAHVALAAIDLDTTNLAYHVTADLSGQIASPEGVKVVVVARTLIAEFFSRLQSILDGEAMAAAPAQAARAVPYQPPRYPPQSNYPDLDARGEPVVARPESASTTDATGGLVTAEPPHDLPPPKVRHPGSLPQTPYRPQHSLGSAAGDNTVVSDGSGSGIGRWFMVIAGVALIALLLNGGFAGVGS